jgi:CDP-diacylglycerol--glycerol-3-phosphate 3-phosphatidyltransferase
MWTGARTARLGPRRILTRMSARAVPAPLARLPNALTLARLALVPVFVVVLATAEGGFSWPAGIIFGVAGVTDQIDGFLARRWRVESRFGAIADPLADRLLIDSAIVVLTIDRRLPWVALALVAVRDVVLAIGGRILARREIVVEVNMVGKAATWILYLAVGCSMVTRNATEWPVDLFWAGLALALIAGSMYVATAWKAYNR